MWLPWLRVGVRGGACWSGEGSTGRVTTQWQTRGGAGRGIERRSDRMDEH